MINDWEIYYTFIYIYRVFHIECFIGDVVVSQDSNFIRELDGGRFFFCFPMWLDQTQILLFFIRG